VTPRKTSAVRWTLAESGEEESLSIHRVKQQGFLNQAIKCDSRSLTCWLIAKVNQTIHPLFPTEVDTYDKEIEYFSIMNNATFILLLVNNSNTIPLFMYARDAFFVITQETPNNIANNKIY
jgi:hypothetical protein